MTPGRRAFSFVLFLLSISSRALGQDPCREWDPAFGVNGLGGGSAECAVEFNDGTGPALYVGGYFLMADNIPAPGIARWNGREWSSLGAGLDDVVHALAVFDDGSGRALYAGRGFRYPDGGPRDEVVKWNGTDWEPLGQGMVSDSDYWDYGAVWTLATFDDGTGPALYAGGTFTRAGGVRAFNVAKWNGQAWSTLGSGLVLAGQNGDGVVFSLVPFDDGTGPALYAAGFFDRAGGVPVAGVARWDGSSWSAVSGGYWGSFRGLKVYDSGAGPVLVAAGEFGPAYPRLTTGVVQWNGSGWSPLGSEIDFHSEKLAVGDLGHGPELFVGFEQRIGNGPAAHAIGRWNGTSWSRIDTKPETAAPLICCDDGHGQSLFVGGDFLQIGDLHANKIARWDDSRWHPVASQVEHYGLEFFTSSMTVLDQGGARTLYVGGEFRFPGEDWFQSDRVARWTGSGWTPLPHVGAYYDGLHTLGSYDDGTGPALYAGGDFRIDGELRLNGIAKWDGARWHSLNGGLSGDYVVVDALLQANIGGRSLLYVGGEFSGAGGLPASSIATWDGSSWGTLGAGISNGTVFALAAFDDGSGPGLYAGGAFAAAGAHPANDVARWDGNHWSALGSGIPPQQWNSWVYSLAVFDDGSGPALYAGGGFTTAGGLPASGVARWRAGRWEPLGNGIGGTVYAMAVLDDGAGPALYVGGHIDRAGDQRANGLARWKSSGWEPVANAPQQILALSAFDDGTTGRVDLYAAGGFQYGSLNCGPIASEGVARWRACR
jgi:hypothetical protein